MTTKSTDTPNVFGCPNTVMRKHREQFELVYKSSPDSIKFDMKPDAPHYSSTKTRIAYMAYMTTLLTDNLG